ncbi:MAG: ATP-binding protein [Cyclobacteriaceae bacterium]|nr:ATP-binding protein [Cyclobacteriaceae bacterium]
MTLNKEKISIWADSDVEYAVNRTNLIAHNFGFADRERNVLTIMVSELARNIYKYAKTGVIVIQKIEKNNKKGLEIIAEDNGPGISDIELALKDGYSSNGTLGLGLAAVKRMSDEFVFDETRNIGTKINVVKWL